MAVGGDVSKPAEAEGIINAAITNYGRLDISGQQLRRVSSSLPSRLTEEHFHKSFNINVLGAILATQAAVKHLGAGGSIINIDLPSAGSRPPTPPSIPPLKAALDAITGVLARELGPRKIRVNSINPGAWRRKARRPRHHRF